jgi:hypothetical protein
MRSSRRTRNLKIYDQGWNKMGGLTFANSELWEEGPCGPVRGEAARRIQRSLFCFLKVNSNKAARNGQVFTSGDKGPLVLRS